MTTRGTLAAAITDPLVLGAWTVLVVASLAVLRRDLRRGGGLGPLMTLVWALTVLYSGPLGLAVYWYAGRTAIPRDSLWRRGFRSTAHCYAGCGAGEVLGLVLAVGVLALGTAGTVAMTFGCAYLLGYALTVGPLLEDGVGLREALTDALLTETPSITVMEVAAVGTDLWLAGEATLGEPLFWAGLTVSLSVGLLVAYPVNVALVGLGVKSGMADPSGGEG